MILFYHMIVCVLVRTTLSYEYVADFTLNITKHVTVMYGDCVNIPYEYTIPWNASLSHKRVWFSDKEEAPLNVQSQDKFLTLPLLSPGEHRFGLRLEWGHKRHTFAETVQVQVSALQKLPIVQFLDNNPMEGCNTTLQCTAPYLCHNECPKFTWVGANVRKVWPRRSVMRFNQETRTVQITPKAEDHNTNITCQLQYRYTTTNGTVTLKVQYSPKILNSSKCTLKDNKVFCRCVSHGNPRPTISWTSPCGFYQSTNTSNNSITVQETVQISDYCNSTIQCVSSNSLGSAKMDLKTQNLTNFTAQLNSIGMGDSAFTLTVPWAITGVSLSVSLVILITLIIVIHRYKQIRKKKCSEEVNMYASLRKTSVEQDYSVISLNKM